MLFCPDGTTGDIWTWEIVGIRSGGLCNFGDSQEQKTFHPMMESVNMCVCPLAVAFTQMCYLTPQQWAASMFPARLSPLYDQSACTSAVISAVSLRLWEKKNEIWNFASGPGLGLKPSLLCGRGASAGCSHPKEGEERFGARMDLHGSALGLANTLRATTRPHTQLLNVGKLLTLQIQMKFHILITVFQAWNSRVMEDIWCFSITLY